MELEEELRVVGNNLKSLELSEEKALEKEDIFAEQIRQLDFRLKEVSTCLRKSLFTSKPSGIPFEMICLLTNSFALTIKLQTLYSSNLNLGDILSLTLQTI